MVTPDSTAVNEGCPKAAAKRLRQRASSLTGEAPSLLPARGNRYARAECYLRLNSSRLGELGECAGKRGATFLRDGRSVQ